MQEHEIYMSAAEKFMKAVREVNDDGNDTIDIRELTRALTKAMVKKDKAAVLIFIISASYCSLISIRSINLKL